jgi:sulfur-carrier protein
MRVLVPSALQSYTGTDWVQAEGATLAAVLTDLDQRFPGICFRVVNEQGQLRRHIRFFHQGAALTALDDPLNPDHPLHIVQALSGG